MLLTASFLTIGLLSITLAGGCPAPQMPNQPPTTSTEPNQPLPTVTPPSTGDYRPVVIPTPEPNAPSPGGPSPGTPGGGTTPPAVTAFLRAYEPLDPRVLRPPAEVNMTYHVTFGSDVSIMSAEQLIARDNDGNGLADGTPVFTRPISAARGDNAAKFRSNDAKPFLSNKLGKFVTGVRILLSDGTELTSYAPGTLTVDDLAPSATWVGAGPAGGALDQADHLSSRDRQWRLQLTTLDNSLHTVTVYLDPDTVPLSGNETQFAKQTYQANASLEVPETRTLTVSLSGFPVGTFRYYYVVTDGYETAAAYAPNPTTGVPARLMLTDRAVGDFNLNRLDPRSTLYDDATGESKGAILQGFNFNDLSGASMVGVPDLNGDGTDEVVIVSRFGKPRVVAASGVGWGEAYFLTGSPGVRLRLPKPLNAVGVPGPTGIPGLVFTGIRAPRDTSWSEGISDVTYVPDMDGDNKPDLVFSFPRVESITLGNVSWQYPELRPYLNGMGSLEYDPADDVVDTVDIGGIVRADYEIPLGNGIWLKNRTQFTRGGIVIVSSANTMFSNPTQLNGRGDRIVDLHEVGQLFSDQERDELRPLIERVDTQTLITSCDGTPTEYERHQVYWDLIYTSQGPVGFDHWLTSALFRDPLNPPLANMRNSGWSLPRIRAEYLAPIDDKCDKKCMVTNHWLPYTPCNLFSTGTSSLYFPAGANPLTDAGYFIHTGFMGHSTSLVSPDSRTVGARVLGQRVNDRFGAAVSADRTWLYISAPGHSALQKDVPDLGAEAQRERSGVVYQYRINSPAYVGGPTRSQLWIEPGTISVLDPNRTGADPNDPNSYITTQRTWPNVDAHRPGHVDYGMPVPHTYIIEEIGSYRGTDNFWPAEWTRVLGSGSAFVPNTRFIIYPLTAPGCASGQFLQTSVQGGVRTSAPCESTIWPTGSVGTCRYYINRTAQIVGPHPEAQISFVRSVGDIDGDGVEDFAVGSERIRSNIVAGTGEEVGAVFIVYGRPTGLEGDYLLERLAYAPTDPRRLAGVIVKGNSAAQKVARVFDAAGDFNGDDYADVLIGGETFEGGRGQALVILGSPTLQSPAGGWSVDDIIASGRAIRFRGASVGDLAGANVAGAGDVDGDGIADILIAAPGADVDVNGDGVAETDVGAVYLIYGSPAYAGRDLSLADVGTVDLPGARFIGRSAGDQLGGGMVRFPADRPGVNLNPDGDPVTVYSRGVTRLGDIDGDGRGDYAIGAMLADPRGRVDAGEVYILYGRGDPKPQP